MNAVSTRLPIAKVALVLESRHRRRLLLIECMPAYVFPIEHAAIAREDLLASCEIDAPYFMLAFTSGLYLWRKDTTPGASPDYTASPETIWRAYLGERELQNPAGVHELNVETAVTVWLEDLAWGTRKLDPRSDADRMLVRSGLYREMERGTVRLDDTTVLW